MEVVGLWGPRIRIWLARPLLSFVKALKPDGITGFFKVHSIWIQQQQQQQQTSKHKETIQSHLQCLYCGAPLAGKKPWDKRLKCKIVEVGLDFTLAD